MVWNKMNCLLPPTVAIQAKWTVQAAEFLSYLGQLYCAVKMPYRHLACVSKNDQEKQPGVLQEHKLDGAHVLGRIL